MKIDHLGYAVKNIEKAVQEFSMLEYSREGEIIDDVERNVRILFMENNGYRIELIEPLGDKSPINNLLAKNGSIPYHICYKVKNIEQMIDKLKLQKYILVSPLAEAIAFNGKKVAFLFNNSIGLLELVEE